MASISRRRASAVTEALLAAVIVTMLAGLSGLTASTQAAPRSVEASQAIEGVLAIRHGDDFTSGRMTGHGYFLMNGQTETELVFQGDPPDDAGGEACHQDHRDEDRRGHRENLHDE